MRIIRFLDERGDSRWGVPEENGQARILVAPPFPEPPRLGHERAAVSRILAPVEPSNVYCVGKNYQEHIVETGSRPPAHPIVFLKPTTAVIGPDASIRIPLACRDTPQVDYEGELAVVVGREARDVSEEDALHHVLGYACANDVTARWWQRHGGGPWARGKGFDGFCPVGPCVVTADEIPDPQSLLLETELNGVIMQRSATSQMLFSVRRLISFLSQDTTLLPGTLILTGTPAGVGFTRTPPVFMRAGDVVAVTISGVGRLENRVEAA
ncbi:MAG: fumarylacetoacetate hydrolase family protein [Candidatus Eisenbacteria bacterium]|jgi:2-keto-4-pentenoate hydratase/2-oxohepta-3-ene-1,7-dioic acid hydratase in catechol pathway|nr:fumarylacetoacetate hydrolase family protein [Candidatus Eisenbacteria bacterium]